MQETEDIVTRLTDSELQTLRNMGNEAETAADEIATLRAEIAALKTVMVAAAEEISAHWQAHCDAEGYGPQNLVRRLEEGIPSEYGYTAGAFAALRAEEEGLRADAERYRWLRATTNWVSYGGVRIDVRNMPEVWDAAIDAARARK